MLRFARNLCAICVNSFIKRHPTALYRWWFASLLSGERRANPELLQYGFELFWNNILSEVNFIFWIQSFYPTNMDFIIRHSYFPRLHSFFQLDPTFLFLRSKVLARDPKLLLWIQGFTSDPKIQSNLKFKHVTSLKACCSVFFNQGNNFFCGVPVFRINSYGRTATKSIDLISKQKKLHLQHTFLHG